MSAESSGISPSLWKGLAAGLVAGLAATAAKSLAEKFYPPRAHDEPAPSELLTERIDDHPLEPSTELVAAEVIHWGFGAAAGAFYGALAEFYPAVTSKEGANFGLALMVLTREGIFPAPEPSPPLEQQTERKQSSEVAAHLIYGVVAERIRSIVRDLLG